MLVKLAWPIAVSMLSISIMALMDTMFVGWLGSASLAGVGLGGTMIFLALCFPMGMLGGAKVLVSQAVGARRISEVRHLVSATTSLALGMAAIIVVLGWLSLHWLPLLAASEQAGKAAVAYSVIRLLSIPAMLLGVAIREIRYGLSDSRSPMVAAIVANLINIALDYVLIFLLGLGVEGAAFATVIAQSVEVTILLAVQLRDGAPRLPSMRHLSAVWQIGMPTGLQWLFEMGAFATLTVMISVLDDVEMAAHQVALQVIHLSFLPAVAVSEAGSVLCGQAVGARMGELVRPVARRALALSGLYMAFCSLVLITAGRPIARVFSDEPEWVRATVGLFVIAAVFQVFDAANLAARGALRGTGDVRFPAWVGGLLSWGLTPTMMWLLGYQLGFGAAGGWIGLCLEIGLGAGVFWWRLERGGWVPASEQVRKRLDTEAPNNTASDVNSSKHEQ